MWGGAGIPKYLTPCSDWQVTYPYVIQQTDDENTQTYQEEVVVLI